MAKKQVLKQKAKKRKWCPIYAPAVFGGQLVGESLVESADNLKGKFINANLSTVSNDMKKQNITVKLRVHKVVDGKGQTEVIGMQIVQGFLKRLVRRGRTKVDDSFTARTKDGQLVRIKPLVITNSNCVASTASQLRLEVKKLLKARVARQGFVNTVQEILSFKLQKELKDKLNSIYPVRSVDIRSFGRETVQGRVPEADLEVTDVDEEPVQEPVGAEEDVSEDDDVEDSEDQVDDESDDEDDKSKKVASEEDVEDEDAAADDSSVDEQDDDVEDSDDQVDDESADESDDEDDKSKKQ